MASHLDDLRSVYERWEQSDLRAGEELLDPEVVARWPSEFPTGGTYHGLEGHRRAMREWLGAWTDFEIAPEDFIEVGDHVVVPFRVRARGRGSGVEVDRRWAHRWTFREGRAVLFEVFLSRDEALRAIGRTG